MKNIKIKTIVVSFFALMLFAGLMSCKKDEGETSSKTSHKVIFKLEASAGSSISAVVYGYDSQITTATNISGTTWSSQEITVPAGTASLNVAASATGANANSTLKAQIFVDGELKGEGTSSGSILSASASFGL
ncbi:hypothetical protein [Pedobacter mendelii]|uniref:BACON domain-containing protein n=1 Tax=Pedobacter mendelii TaxID=1908240 RepID=A0ABQ2BLN1_9SPHI|nr:hypothetical protein [Pedobacter mendelii]GGI27615.1 hypothetical protein GCM10008119_28530 [Pedobacter mendelii]